MVRRFILNADDVGLEKSVNNALLECLPSNFLKSLSVCSNGEYFSDFVNKILPKCEGTGCGVHLNITKGKSLCMDLDKLVNQNCEFNQSFLKLFIKSYNKKDTEFLLQVEREFRRQIETLMSKTKVTHIDSHCNIHAIPPIFDIVCRLAKEYGIDEVRTHFEYLYFIPDVTRIFNKKYLFNTFKALFFNFLTIFNENTVKKYELKTNDYIIGMSYYSNFDSLAISYGLKRIKYNNATVEAVVHPCRYDDGRIDNRFGEYLIIKNPKLKHKIERLGYKITNYVKN